MTTPSSRCAPSSNCSTSWRARVRDERRMAAPKALAPPRGDGPQGQGGPMSDVDLNLGEDDATRPPPKSAPHSESAYAELDHWVDDHFDEEVRFLQELVRVPT